MLPLDHRGQLPHDLIHVMTIERINSGQKPASGRILRWTSKTRPFPGKRRRPWPAGADAVPAPAGPGLLRQRGVLVEHAVDDCVQSVCRFLVGDPEILEDGEVGRGHHPFGNEPVVIGVDVGPVHPRRRIHDYPPDERRDGLPFLWQPAVFSGMVGSLGKLRIVPTPVVIRPLWNAGVHAGQVHLSRFGQYLQETLFPGGDGVVGFYVPSNGRQAVIFFKSIRDLLRVRDPQEVPGGWQYLSRPQGVACMLPSPFGTGECWPHRSSSGWTSGCIHSLPKTGSTFRNGGLRRHRPFRSLLSNKAK